MADYEPSRRRVRASKAAVATPPAPPLLRLCAERLALANDAASGSPEAVRYAQEALTAVALAIRPALGAALYSGADDDAVELHHWLAVVRFLEGAQLFPNELRSLVTELAGMEQGYASDRLVPAKRHKKKGARELSVIRVIVEAADELSRRCLCTEEFNEYLKQCGVRNSTVYGLRKLIEKAPPEFRPRSYLLTWGMEQPQALLDRALKTLKKVSATKKAGKRNVRE